MNKDRQVLGLMIALAILLSSSAVVSRACIYDVPTYHVGQKFLVSLTNEGDPVTGKQMKVTTSDGKEVGAANTNSKGIATFAGLAPGHYFLQAADGHGEFGDLDVAADQSEQTIALKWPEMRVIKSRTASGTIRLAEDFSPVLARATLIDALSSREMASEDVNGTFHLGSIPDGLYFLRIAESKEKDWSKLEGDIAIQISATSSVGELDLLVGETDCGLYYAESCKPQPPTEVTGICGKVVDSEGAAIERVRIQLNDKQSAETIALGETERDGHFQHNNGVPEGRYTLSFISDEGFTRLDLPVDLHSGSCRVPLHVTMGIFGQCGSAELGYEKLPVK